MNDSTETTEHNNASFAYEYTQKTLEKVNKGIDALTTKLGGALAFSGVLLKFTETLSNEGWLVWLKIAVCFFLTVAIASCGFGLSPVNTGKVVDPESFLNPTIYRLPDEECKLLTMRQALQGISELDQVIKDKQEHLNVAITLIVLSAIGIALSISVNSLEI
jgi:hypothetical protein